MAATAALNAVIGGMTEIEKASSVDGQGRLSVVMVVGVATLLTHA